MARLDAPSDANGVARSPSPPRRDRGRPASSAGKDATRTATADKHGGAWWTRLPDQLELWYFRYSVTVGIYMLDRWERYLFNAVAVGLVAALLRAAWTATAKLLL